METVAVYADRKALRRYFLIGVGFVVIGVVITFGGHPVVGPVCAVFFGAVATMYGMRYLNPKPLYELSPAGLRPWTGGLVPWRDVEDVGAGVLGRYPIVGVRLSDYLPYVRSAVGDMPTWKRISDAITALMAFGRVRGLENLSRAERNVVILLDWTRRKTAGLDLYWPARLLTGSPEELVNQIRTYRDEALKGDPR